MFSTFADVFATSDEEKKKFNGTNDTLTATTTVDPFGVSSDMKLSASSQRFDDTPFVINTNQDDFNRSKTGDGNGSSSFWNANKSSKNERIIDPPSTVTFDPLDVSSTKTSSLAVGNITHSKSINLIDPFLIPAAANENPTESIKQISPIDLLFDLNVDPSTLSPTTTDSFLQRIDPVQSSYDLLGLNQKNISPVTISKVLKSDSLTEIEKLSQAKKASPSSLLAKSNMTNAASYHSLPTNVPITSASTLRVQATALSIMTGTTSTTPFDDQFLDWLTQSDDLMCSVDPKLSGLSKKMDINMIKSTEDLLGSIYRPVSTLSTLVETTQESVSSPPAVNLPQMIRRPSNEDLPSICIHEPTSEHNDSNIVPEGYFDASKKNQTKDDSDDSDDSKMVFKILEKKTDGSTSSINIPVPLLPPPPSPSSSSSKKSKTITDGRSESSSSTDNEEDNDPLAVFRSKTEEYQKKGSNLIVDWDENQTATYIEQDRVGKNSLVVAFVCVVSLSSSTTKFNHQHWTITYTNPI